LTTLHRPSNADDLDRLRAIFDGLARTGEPVIFPCHPRTRAAADALFGNRLPASVQLIDPLPHGALLALLISARVVVTDSGGIQKEAAFLGVPCLTVRSETEWPETTASGWNRLVPDQSRTLAAALADAVRRAAAPEIAFDRGPFGDGHAAERVVDALWVE
jgi:UDP-N-acetylglucosamine 2-epimerase